MRHLIQKEPNDMLSFCFCCVFFFFMSGEGELGGGGGRIYYLLFISNYLEFKHYFSLITSADVKTVE